jgi:hypothetical protein
MHFIRMKDMALTREAVSSRASVTECLDARKGHADRIGVVAMRRKGLADEPRFQTLNPCASAADPDTASGTISVIGRAFAQAFKTTLAALK